MISKVNKNEARTKRHGRIRNKINGTSLRPRLSVYRSTGEIYAQLIDDENGNTLVSSSSIELKCKNGGNVEAAKAVGKSIAEKAKKKGIKKVVFDRSGYEYHGRVEALADAARENGLEF